GWRPRARCRPRGSRRSRRSHRLADTTRQRTPDRSDSPSERRRPLMPYALIVDDDKACLEALDEVVRDYGFETSTATSVAEAVRSVRLRAPDLMLLDLYLPDGNSIELLRELQPSTPGKVVLITGHASVDTAVDALRMGVDDYLTKPLDIEQMRGLL